VTGEPDATGGTVTDGLVTRRGIVVDGVEAGCVLLDAEDGQDYLLVGGDPAVLVAGGRVEVSGLPQPDLMTICQQGIPFSVRSARRI
jgi:hypothetical protein